MSGLGLRHARLLMATVALGAMGSLASAQQPAAAPKPSRTSATPLEVISKGLKLRPDPVEPKDFVRDSRPSEEQLNFIPAGSVRPQPPSKPMTADQVKAREAELQAVLTRHDRISGRKPAARATTGATKPKPAVVVR